MLSNAADIPPELDPVQRRCRFCGADLTHVVIDLGMSPLANSYLTEADLSKMEPFYPLRVFVCSDCLLVQLEQFETPGEIFGDYAYFSSYSTTWLEHARSFAETAAEQLQLGPGSHVVEVASNDGYLLQFFAERGIPVLGIEPAGNVAAAAVEKGIPTVVDFFGEELARSLVHDAQQGDLIIGNNVLAHVPDLNDFVAGIALLLRPDGVVTMEFPHLVRLIEGIQFDTIYHEHFSYFSFLTVQRVFETHGMSIFDVEELPTHGGSLRIYGQLASAGRPATDRVPELATRERDAGFAELDRYLAFGERVQEAKRDILDFLISARRNGKTVVGYGAPAKGNTLLNYCGIRKDFLEYTVDLSPHKQGHYLPGTHIPIRSPDALRGTRPDYVFILPWNIKEEIMEQMAVVRDWGGRFVTAIPTLTVHP